MFHVAGGRVQSSPHNFSRKVLTPRNISLQEPLTLKHFWNESFLKWTCRFPACLICCVSIDALHLHSFEDWQKHLRQDWIIYDILKFMEPNFSLPRVCVSQSQKHVWVAENHKLPWKEKKRKNTIYFQPLQWLHGNTRICTYKKSNQIKNNRILRRGRTIPIFSFAFWFFLQTFVYFQVKMWRGNINHHHFHHHHKKKKQRSFFLLVSVTWRSVQKKKYVHFVTKKWLVPSSSLSVVCLLVSYNEPTSVTK